MFKRISCLRAIVISAAPLFGLGLLGCAEQGQPKTASPGDETLSEDRHFRELRAAMVETQLRGRDVTDREVLRAMESVPRHRFVPPKWLENAYEDRPLPIGNGQTISQPYIVALMTQLAQPKPSHRVLDVGTGSGYQAAVLAELVEEVCSIEIIESLADEARSRLTKLGHDNIEVRTGDGYQGWPEKAPFDIIVVAAAPNHIPPPLIEQLAPNGHLIIPVGESRQFLTVVSKDALGKTVQKRIVPVAFVPMTGEARESE